MIKLKKGPPPKILAKKAKEWTNEYRRHRAGDPKAPKAAGQRYRHPEIKQAVMTESHQKCMYCESRPRAVSPGDVEHILPKSRFPDRVVAWENLGFACSECNREKSDFYDKRTPLLNPYADDPAPVLLFAGPMIRSAPAHDSASLTLRQLKLNRPDLFERRYERLKHVDGLVQGWGKYSDGPLRDAIAQEIHAEGENHREYAATVRAFLEGSGVPKPGRRMLADRVQA